MARFLQDTKVIHVMTHIRILLQILSLTVSAAAFSQNDARSIIQSNYDKISHLSIKMDKVNLERTIRKNASSQFKYIDSMKNELDLSATVRQNSEQLSKVHKFISDSNKIVGVREKGSDLVCTVKTSYDVYLDAGGADRIKGVSFSEDTWTKTLTGWKIKKTVVINESTTHNGKVVR
jgi:hypothetical protein